MQELAERYKLGIRVDQVQLKNVNPPAEVQASFNEVNKAQQDRENAINIANGDYNQAVPRARGEADQAIRAAEGYRFKRVNEAEGDVASFNAMLGQYMKAPEITRTRLYLETMGDVLPLPAKKSSSMIRCETCCRSCRSPKIRGEEMNARGCFTLLIVVVAIVVCASLLGWFFAVHQTEQVIITQFGKPVGEPITDPGLHFKMPIIQEINRIDKRFLEWDGQPVAIPTRDKTYIHVETFARWRISDAKTFFVRLRDERSAQSRLEDILGSETRNAVAKNDLIEIVRTNKDRKPLQDENLKSVQTGLGTIGVLPPIQFGR